MDRPISERKKLLLYWPIIGYVVGLGWLVLPDAVLVTLLLFLPMFSMVLRGVLIAFSGSAESVPRPDAVDERGVYVFEPAERTLSQHILAALEYPLLFFGVILALIVGYAVSCLAIIPALLLPAEVINVLAGFPGFISVDEIDNIYTYHILWTLSGVFLGVCLYYKDPDTINRILKKI